MTSRTPTPWQPPAFTGDDAADRFIWSHERLSTVSDRTIRRWGLERGIEKARTKRERKFWFSVFIALDSYYKEIDRCVQSEAHFAAGILWVSLCEIYLVLLFLQYREKVAKSREYRRCFFETHSGKMRIKSAFRRVPFETRLIGLELNSLFSIARQVGLLTQMKPDEDSEGLLRKYCYPADANGWARLLRDARNQLHFKQVHHGIPRFAPPENGGTVHALRQFHYEFACLAFRFHQKLKGDSSERESDS